MASLAKLPSPESNHRNTFISAITALNQTPCINTREHFEQLDVEAKEAYLQKTLFTVKAFLKKISSRLTTK